MVFRRVLGGLGVRAQGLGFRVLEGLGFRVWGVEASGFRVGSGGVQGY